MKKLASLILVLVLSLTVASAALAELGYTEVYEFGGINTWPYETE